MKRLAAMALVVLAVPVSSTPARAQVPFVYVTFDDALYPRTDGSCRGFLVPDTVYVVARNFNMLMSTIEYAIEPPTADAVWIDDVHLPGSLHLGQSPTGVTITYPIPLNAFSPVIVMKYAIVWLCSDCSEAVPYVHVDVIGHPYSGLIEAIEWNTYRKVQGVGVESYICYLTFGTEPTTWGRVKSLYR